MPRQVPHFKAHVSVKNHTKMAAVYANNDLFALWTRLGLEAITRFADRTGDSFIVSDRELMPLTGKGRPDVARTLLERLADVSPMSARRDGDVWLITLPNFAKKQGFGPRNGKKQAPSSTTTSSSTSIPPLNTPPPNPEPPPVRAKKRAVPFPLDASSLAESVMAWVENHPELGEVDVDYAIETMRDWAESKGETKPNWLAAMRKGIRSGWLIRDPGSGPRREQKTFAQMRVENTNNAAKELMEEIRERDKRRANLALEPGSDHGGREGSPADPADGTLPDLRD